VYSTILHATDLSQHHYNICQQAVNIAKRFDAKLYLLHVMQPPASLQIAQGLGFAELDAPIKEEAQIVMNLLGETFEIPEEQLLVEVGSIKHTILNQSKSLNCGLIIIGSHTPTHLPPFLGSTAYSIIHNAECDVLTLRTCLDSQK